MVLAAVATIWGKVARVPVIVDRHSTFMLNRKYRVTPGLILFRILNELTLRLADLTIVTNRFLADIVERKGGRAFVLPDRLPEIAAKAQPKFEKNTSVSSFLVVGSFADDEPLGAVIAASAEMGEQRPRILVSGRVAKAPPDILRKAEGLVEFTDFLPDAEYLKLVSEVDGVVVLTTADHTMLCGCYEAVAAENALITSNKGVLKEYFDSAVFVDNSPESIADALRGVMVDRESKRAAVIAMKGRLADSWRAQATRLDALILNMESSVV
jgi:hypothetical protein